jgi:hypothetical protein
MAAMASPLSKTVTPETITGAIGRGAAEGPAAGLAEVAGAETRAGVAGPEDGGGAGALDWAETATGAAALADDGAPGASVGSLIVGDEVGLGGKLMRTVSFFGWTFEASAGLGGRAPPGDVGKLSAIFFSYAFNVKLPLAAVKPELQLPSTSGASRFLVGSARGADRTPQRGVPTRKLLKK